ncbi:hypothetical protein ABXV18_26970 [Vibrio owensii]|uniref:hypothetical protein n=1 Tax=Vibrio owensii TaxID=696485 RepID=UPI0033959C2C
MKKLFIAMTVGAALTGCQATSKPTYDIDVNSKFNQTNIKAGTYLLAVDHHNDERNINRQTYGPSQECAKTLINKLRIKGFERVYNQQNADYIVRFNCKFEVLTTDNGYKATANYGVSVSSSNGMITNGLSSARVNSTTIGTKINSIDIKKSTTSHVSNRASVAIYKNHDSFSNYDRELLWHGMSSSSTWSGHPQNKRLAPYDDLMTVTFDYFNLKKNAGDFYGGQPEIITRPYFEPNSEAGFMTTNDPFLYAMELKEDSRSNQIGYAEHSFLPWQTVYSKGNRISYKQKTGFELVTIAAASIANKRGSVGGDLAFYERGEKSFFILLVDNYHGDLSEDYDVFIYDGNQRVKTRLEVMNRRNNSISFFDTDGKISEMLSASQGKEQDFLTIAIPELRLEIPFRKEGFKEANKIAY